MDYDFDSPKAREQACDRVLAKIDAPLPAHTPFPTCQDMDNDGVPNGLDNYPKTPNPDPADGSGGTVFRSFFIVSSPLEVVFVLISSGEDCR